MTYEDLLAENLRLRARIRELEHPIEPFVVFYDLPRKRREYVIPIRHSSLACTQR